jgi:hypothetical protein
MFGFLKSLFGGAPPEAPAPAAATAPATPTEPAETAPDNTRLYALLTAWAAHETPAAYREVVEELLHGNAQLLLPSINDGAAPGSWQTLTEGSTLKLTCVFEVEGLPTLAAFTDEAALLAWAGQPSQYTALRAADALEFCQDHGIGRVVLNSNAPNMFVLERSQEGIKTEVIEQDTPVRVGAPRQPLPAPVAARLAARCRGVSVVAAVYQYGMQRHGEFSLVLGFQLDSYAEEARQAALHAVQDALQGVKLDLPLDVFMLEDPDWLATVQDIDNALVYRRQA